VSGGREEVYWRIVEEGGKMRGRREEGERERGERGRTLERRGIGDEEGSEADLKLGW